MKTKQKFRLKPDFYKNANIDYLLQTPKGDQYVEFWINVLQLSCEKDIPGLIRFDPSYLHYFKQLEYTTNTHFNIVIEAMFYFVFLGFLIIEDNKDIRIHNIFKWVILEDL